MMAKITIHYPEPQMKLETNLITLERVSKYIQATSHDYDLITDHKYRKKAPLDLTIRPYYYVRLIDGSIWKTQGPKLLIRKPLLS